MPTYDQWNMALAEYVTRDRPRGSAVYLHVNEEILNEIGDELGIPSGSAEQHFLDAVFMRCVRTSEWGAREIDTAFLDPRPTRRGSVASVPNSVAFLGMTVLAASRMGEREDLDPGAYFPIVRGLLQDIPRADVQNPRPRGWELGAEQAWWDDWAGWLSARHMVATVTYGQHGSWKYVNLPVSQTLLRSTDEERLLRLFNSHLEFGHDHTDQHLMRLIQRYVDQLTKQLCRILEDQNRLAEATGAIFALHADWRSGYRVAGPSESRRQASPITIVRDTDFFDGTQYALQAGSGDMPALPALDEHLLAQGTLISHAGKRYRLPRRDIWIFAVTDDAVESRMTSVNQARAGVPTVLLARRSTLPQIRQLSRLGVLKWAGDWNAVLPSPFEGWIEISDCSVIPGDWPDNEAADALRPRERVRMSFTRGMSVGERYVWLNGLLPQVTIDVSGNSASVKVQLAGVDARGEDVSRPLHVLPGVATPIGPLDPGLYRLQCEASGERMSRDFEVKDPLALGLGERAGDLALAVGPHRVFGADIFLSRGDLHHDDQDMMGLSS